MRIPTENEIRALHLKYAPTSEALDLVLTHSEIVCGIAEQLAAGTETGLDVDLVRAGCLLHDIGVYRLYGDDGKLQQARYIQHGILGHELLAGEGFPEAICRFCSCHTGMGISRDDVLEQRLPLPVADYLAKSKEEEMVMYADKFHSKTDPPTFVSASSYAAQVRRFGAEKALAFEAMCEKFGIPDLGPFIEKYGHGQSVR